jgi:hypothetical protein
VLWEIVTRQQPFEHYHFNYEVLDAVCSGERPSLSDDCDADIKSLITDCWNDTPNKRPSFRQIKERLAVLHDASMYGKGECA